MKIAILDDNKTFLSYIKKTLNKLNMTDIYLFENENEFIEFCKKENSSLDAVFIDYHLKTTTGIDVLKNLTKALQYTYKLIITSDENVKQEALNSGFDAFLAKNFSFFDLQGLINTIKTLRFYIKKEIQKQKTYQNLIQYKETQEKIVLQKQSKIIKNELEMFFENNYLFETFFKSKDLLTGDNIYSTKIDNNKYIIVVMDAMGKSLGASLTVFNALSFLKHSVCKAIEYNDFNFQKLVKDFVTYIKEILLDNEIFCATLIYIENNHFYYANFGNPAILTNEGIIKANNFPIRKYNDEIIIDKCTLAEKMLIFTDGLIEAPYKNGFYYKRLKETFKNIVFLKDIIKDFKNNSKFIDDTSIVFFRKNNFKTKELFKETIKITKENLDNFLNKIYNLNIEKKEQIHLILYEILTNTLEHSVYEIKDKEKECKEIVKNNQIFVTIKLSKNEEFIKIEYEDNSKGFEVQKIKDSFYKKYHGRGIKIIKHLADAVFYNENGNKIKIYIKVKNGT